MDLFITSMLTLERWPFWATALVLTVVVHFLSRRLFTRERAYAKTASQSFWWWGRESLVLHPLLFGIGVGFLWPDPEGRKWSQAATCVYFAAAGAVSLVLWTVIKGVAKKKGLNLVFPGESNRPES